MSGRWVIFGNSGSGKSTLARQIAGRHGVPHLDLDSIAWGKTLERLPMEESLARLDAFIADHAGWVIEGCYGSLIGRAAARCSRLVFLNPGVDACVANCRRRPWEPHKFASPAEQDAMLENLIEWVKTYESRDDEFGLAAHRRVFDAFAGEKIELNTLDYDKRI